MLRGCQKRIFYVKNPESDIFDEAYFILRRGAGIPQGRGGSGKTIPHSQIKLEAERLMTDAGSGSARVGAKSKKERIAAFLLGIAVSAAIAFVLWITLK